MNKLKADTNKCLIRNSYAADFDCTASIASGDDILAVILAAAQ